MISPRLLFWSLTASLAGFLFGFDTVVISGAEQTIQTLWKLSSGLHGLAMSMALWGTVVGSLVGGWPTERFGRTRTLQGIGVFYLISALGSALAPDAYSFMLARFLGGLGVGISTVAAPLYIAEISPADSRGKLAGLFQFNIVFGILVAYLSNALLGGMGANAWRWMLGVEAIPALVFALASTTLPESPRWFIAHAGRKEEARSILARIAPEASEAALAQQVEMILQASQEKIPKNNANKDATPFWSTSLRRPITLAFLIAFFNQLSGINAILYFAPRIFKLAGLGGEAALLQSIGIGVTNLIFTFVGLALIDRLGRRTLLVLGSIGYILSLGSCAWGFHSGNFGVVPISLFAFIAAHAIGQGTVIWVFIGEIFPTHHRASGQALGSFTHWIFAAVLTLIFPKLVTAFPPETVFAFFCGMMGLQLLWVWGWVPETRGVPLEEMQARLAA
jgi:sugar porter (SP) family MFS transporter